VLRDNPNPYLLKDIEYPSDYPVFRFCPNPLRTESVVESSEPCQCCGKVSKYSYVVALYLHETDEEIIGLCLDCISNGEAARKYKVAFTERDEIANRTTDKAATEEIMYRTPSFSTWQEREWLSHCKMPCAYIGQVYIGDLLKMGIYKQVRTELAKTFYYKNMPMTVAEIDDMLIQILRCAGTCSNALCAANTNYILIWISRLLVEQQIDYYGAFTSLYTVYRRLHRRLQSV